MQLTRLALRSSRSFSKFSRKNRYGQYSLLSTSTTGNKLQRQSKSSAVPMAKMSTTVPPEDAISSRQTELVGKRFKLTAEVIASKIFWAGFGWQGSSIIADQMGFTAESMNFALTTGVGEACAVVTGHTLFYLAKGSSFKQEIATALWLGTGTFCSGTAWQPVVNALVTLTNNNFPMTGAGTMVICGSAFYVGLRLGRIIWGETFSMPIAKRDYENLLSDAGLSVAIGGATGIFVACDPSMAMNIFASGIGVLDTDSNIVGMCKAGIATSLGYGMVQSWQNFFPKGRNWMDLYLK
eukprot:1341344-Amorphochlora_amoeboformis.AAC.1